MATQKPITPERVRELFHYDPQAGILTWRIAGGSGAHCHVPGDIAGSDDSKGYFQVNFDGRVLRLHRVIWCWVTSAWLPPSTKIDHIDGNGRNNRWSNLRPATHAQNMANKRRPSNNSSGVKGVGYDRRKNVWFAQVRASFPTKEDAIAAYRKMAEAAFGEFARAI